MAGKVRLRRPLWMTGVNTDPSRGPYFTEEQVASQAADRRARIIPPSDDLAISRILKVFRRATPQDFQEGMSWYQTAHEECKKLVESRPTIVKSVIHAAGIIAALSPQIQWNDNIRRATELVARGDTHGTADRVQKAELIMKGDNPFEVLFAKRTSNWKVRSFFMNIAFPDWRPEHAQELDLPDGIELDPQYVTIDRHALGMIYDDRTIGYVKVRSTKREYNWARDLFIAAAGEFDGVSPQQVQAATWVAWRSRQSVLTDDEAPRLFTPD